MPSHTMLLANYAEKQDKQSSKKAMLQVRSQPDKVIQKTLKMAFVSAAESESDLLTAFRESAVLLVSLEKINLNLFTICR